MANKPIPQHPRRVLLVNPTKYLGNLLIAGGLMQAYADHCHANRIELRILIDEAFLDLCADSFPRGMLLTFPRRAINQAGALNKAALYLRQLRCLRDFRADLAFNIEEDSATSHLTRFSGAVFKLGCSRDRHGRGYDHVIPVQFENRPEQRQHRWYSLYDVFAALGMPEPSPGYLNLTLNEASAPLRQKLAALGLRFDKPVIALHAGATKDYKKWPLEHMAALCSKLLAAGLQPVLFGAGNNDLAANRTIRELLAAEHQPAPMDLCNCLSLTELAQFLLQCRAMVGNDSGPFHLGSALGVPGFVLWGPTNRDIWGPLGKQSRLVNGRFTCATTCNKGHCDYDYRCMKSITPEQVLAGINSLA